MALFNLNLSHLQAKSVDLSGSCQIKTEQRPQDVGSLLVLLFVILS